MRFVWVSIVLVICAILLLRISGRKSLAQMTIGTTVVMLSMGAIIVQPIVDKGVWKTIGAIAVFNGVLIGIEYLQLHSRWLERLFSAKPIVVIDNGHVYFDRLKRMRITKSKFEMRLRQMGLDRIDDIQVATIESNGELGYTLKPQAQPITKRDFRAMLEAWRVGQEPTPPKVQKPTYDLFAGIHSFESEQAPDQTETKLN